jgi:CRP-like cAMP-binding protein
MIPEQKMNNTACDPNRMSPAHIIIKKIESSHQFHVIFAAEEQSVYFFNKGTQYIYLLREGQVEIRRNSDNMVISHVKSPSVVGLAIRSEQENYHYIKTTMPTELMAVKKDTAFELFSEDNLWREAFSLCVDIVNSAYMRDEICTTRNVYKVVRNHLELLWTMEEPQRSSTSLFEFIMDRTKISRSSLNKIVKELSAGGYIKTYRGKLLDKKTLPMNY